MHTWLDVVTAPLAGFLRHLDTVLALQGIENARDAMLENERRLALQAFAGGNVMHPKVTRTA